MVGNRGVLSKMPSMLRTQIRAQQIARQFAAEEEEGFKEFNASVLHCPKCQRAMPVRERLLLVLPSGNVYDYHCSTCGTSVGTKRGN